MKIFSRLAVSIVCICIACSACDCLKSGKASCIRTEGSDSTMIAALGDSISRIILNAGKAKAVNSSTDMPAESDKELTLNNPTIKTLQFLLEDPTNYKSNRPIYGQFNPSVSYTFYSHHKQVTIACDHGLGKFAVVDKAGKQLAIFDIGNADMLRFALTLYPTDKLLKAINQTDKK